ncbi:MAG TPA: hypothetical protein P5333_04685 [Caldilinea sp.]|nr:hypothetical protein [Caldilinea sp.]
MTLEAIVIILMLIAFIAGLVAGVSLVMPQFHRGTPRVRSRLA